MGKIKHLNRLEALHKEHPEYCSKELALTLGLSWSYVRSTLINQHWRVPPTPARKVGRPYLRTKDYVT